MCTTHVCHRACKDKEDKASYVPREVQPGCCSAACTTVEFTPCTTIVDVHGGYSRCGLVRPGCSADIYAPQATESCTQLVQSCGGNLQLGVEPPTDNPPGS